jgi:epoxyqueuosine reductase
MSPADLSTNLKQRAAELGFQLCGICPAVAPPGATKLDEWFAAGFAGQMHYLADRREAYDHPRHVLDGARSVVMLAMHYRTEEPAHVAPGEGRVSRYAWGTADYHDVIRDRLHQLADYLRELSPDARTRGVVDTAPLLEREFAQLAGLGWVGKNTLLLSKHAGSYFFLAALLTDQSLQYDEPFAADHCGTCTACLDACPTDAFPQPYVLDASRCISYLTIELQDSIPAELRAGVGDWLFGCDVCQDVCPWNHDAPRSEEPSFEPLAEMNPVDLAQLFTLTEDDFRSRFRRTPLWRAHRRGLLRNAAIVLGNQRHEPALPALATGLSDEEPLVRGACAWALGELDSSGVDSLLQQALTTEKDLIASTEIAAALGRSLQNNSN